MTPSIRPAIIDSHGKPGIAGSIIGVETELVVELTVVVGVLATVTVDTAVLTTVVANGLVAVIAGSVDDAALELVIDEDTIVVTGETLEVVVSVEVEVVPPLLTVGGTIGSRWKMPLRPSVRVLGCAPTAQPSVGFVVKTENKPNPLATDMGIARLVQDAPFHQAVNAFPEHVEGIVVVRATLQPTAHPSPLPAVVPYESTWTDVHVAVEGPLAALPTAQSPPLLIVVMIVLSAPTIQPWFESEK